MSAVLKSSVALGSATKRILFAGGLIGAPMMLVEGLYRQMAHIPRDADNGVVACIELLYLAGWACTAIRMRQQRILGSGTGSAFLSTLQMIMLGLAAVFSSLVFFGEIGEGAAVKILRGVTDSCWPLSHLLMLVVAFFVLKAGVWRGWRRIPAFIVGGTLFIALPLMALGTPVEVFGLLTGVGFIGLALAAREIPEEAVANPAFRMAD